jgi:citrate lyase beta subunit
VSPQGGQQVPALEQITHELDQLLAVSDAALESGYPGDAAWRQPVHTAYIPAHQFDRDSVASWGALALEAMAEHAPGPAELAAAMEIDPALAAEIQRLMLAKFGNEPIEDLRVDFEDGYGSRDDETEDAHARNAARSLAWIIREGTGRPPFLGLRCKGLERPTRRRAIRTLHAFIGALVESGRPLPPGFVVTLPKVTSVAQVAAMTVLCQRLESAYGLTSSQRLTFEIQVETPQLVLGHDGSATIARCVHAGAGRLSGLHYGTYDYTAALGIPAAQQSLDHPAADYAKSVMQVAAAGTGVRLSDGSSNILPVGARDEVIAAWRLHAGLVRRSLRRGFYQGWDLHPAQLVSRYAATYAFFRGGLTAACARLRAYGDRAAAGREEPATARALATFLLRALECGAATEAEITDAAALDLHQLRAARRRGHIPGGGPGRTS